MVRMIFILVFVILAFVLIRYRNNETVQKRTALGLVGVLVLYVVTLVISELMR